MAKRLPAPLVRILRSTETVARGQTDFRFRVAGTVDMHVHYVLLGVGVVDHFRPLNDAVWPQVARGASCQQRSDEVPLDQICRREAVDCRVFIAVGLVFSDPLDCQLRLSWDKQIGDTQ